MWYKRLLFALLTLLVGGASLLLTLISLGGLALTALLVRRTTAPARLRPRPERQPIGPAVEVRSVRREQIPDQLRRIGPR